MCNCVNVKMGSYDNQVELPTPKFMLPPLGDCSVKTISVDRCIADEIMWLWKNKITTIASCCGHNLYDGFISVSEECIPKMEKLGYKHRENETDPSRKDSFYPKTALRVRESIKQKINEVSNYFLNIIINSSNLQYDKTDYTLSFNIDGYAICLWIANGVENIKQYHNAQNDVSVNLNYDDKVKIYNKYVNRENELLLAEEKEQIEINMSMMKRRLKEIKEKLTNGQ